MQTTGFTRQSSVDGDIVDLLTQVFAESPMGASYIDPRFILRWANSVFADQVGGSVDDLMGRPIRDVMPEWEEQVGCFFEQVRDTGKSWHASTYAYVFPGRPERGTTYWDSSLTPIRGSHGEFRGWLLIHNEVTEWVVAEKMELKLAESLRMANGRLAASIDEARQAAERERSLREEMSRLAAIVESSDDAIIGKTLDGIIVSPIKDETGKIVGASAIARGIGQQKRTG